MKTLKLFLICTFVYTTRGQWIDPHSMDTNYKSKLPNHSTMTTEENSKDHILTAKEECDSDVHLRRIVRLILSNAYLDNDVDYHEGYINIRLSTVEHQFLVNFSQSTYTEKNEFNEISSIFENAFQKPSLDRYQEIILSMQEKLYYLVFNPTSGSLAGTCLALYITYKLIRARFTWQSIIKYFAFLLYIADFIITYLHIIQEDEIDSMVNIKKLGMTPPECDPQKMSWWKYTKTQFESAFFENPCKVYYQATFQNYKHYIAPSKILTRQFRTMILGPVGDMGEAFGKFGRGMFANLPWGLNVVLFPIMLLASFIIIFIIFLFITKPHFKLSLFHLFTIELGERERAAPLPRLPEINRAAIEHGPGGASRRRNRNNGREVGFATDHRELVEDVSNDNPSRDGSSQNEPERTNENEKDQNQDVNTGKNTGTEQKTVEHRDNDSDNASANSASSSESFVQL